jgi:hypothetical protein
MKKGPRRLSAAIKLILLMVMLVISVLAITNPGISDFKGYTKSVGFNSDYQVRTGNYFIFSTYQCGDYSYIGVFRQFVLTRSPLGADQ